MFTRILTPGATAAALLLGVFSHQAAAAEETVVSTEEIVVYGNEVVARIQAREAMFRSEMDEYIRAVNERIKATLREGVKEQVVPKLEVATAEEPARG